MTDIDSNPTTIKVNPSIANWRAFNEGLPWLGSEEYPMFTDAWITGEIDLGPYSFLNTVAASMKREVKPGIVLRYAIHREWDYPDFRSTDAVLYHGGSPAEELAALASLCMGVRFRAGRSIRRFEPGRDPKGHPEEIGEQVEPYFKCSVPPVIPSPALGQHAISAISPLATLPNMAGSQASALVRAARLFQDALWLCESEPELSWLLFVSAAESAANEWHKEEGDVVDRLRTSKPALFEYLEVHSDNKLLPLIADEFSDTLGSTQKFVKFCLTHLPAAPPVRPVEWAQFSWTKRNLREAFSKIYHYLSRALHDGHPFPAPMCAAPGRLEGWEAPSETMTSLGTHQRGGTWLKKDVPFYIHIFEYITRNAILEWWRRCTIPENRPKTS
jgi:hypothetical protein